MSNMKVVRETIMKHYRNPEFAGKLDDANEYKAFSDRCIDNTTLFIKGNTALEAIRHTSEGCSAFLASTDLLIKTIALKSKDSALKIVGAYENMIKEKEFDESLVGELIVFKNIGKQMNRAECALTSVGAIRKWIKDDHAN